MNKLKQLVPASEYLREINPRSLHHGPVGVVALFFVGLFNTDASTLPKDILY